MILAHTAKYKNSMKDIDLFHKKPKNILHPECALD